MNITLLNEGSAKDYDLYLQKEAKKFLSGRSMEIIEWKSSQLDETENFKRLVTTYIVKAEVSFAELCRRESAIIIHGQNK